MSSKAQKQSQTSALEHLRACDPILGQLIDRIGPLDASAHRRGRPQDPYGVLVRSIVGQQLSTKAAQTIFDRVIDLFGGQIPTPENLLAVDRKDLRLAGLSESKVSYLRDLAQHIDGGRLDLASLWDLSDEEVSAQLTQVKGLGQWTADMFLLFCLKRPDVLAAGDLGIKRAVARLYTDGKPPQPRELFELSKPWRPNRSLACLYLWRSLDQDPV
jgi:DNA-3-methyladenine glycosylase II